MRITNTTTTSPCAIADSFAPCSLAGISSSSAAATAPIRAPPKRSRALTVVCSRLGFIATMAATGIQSPWDRLAPNASATVPAMTRARITANMMTGRVSGCRDVSPGISAISGGASLRPRMSQPMNVAAIQSADPAAQANACVHVLLVM